MSGTSSELQDLTHILYGRAGAYEVSTEKSKIMVKSTMNTSADITMNSQKREEVANFKNLGQPCPRMVPVPLRSEKELPW
ncbi:hypothetical protein DPMN_003644 [Dreissena polymorpha]|uniref:Uncharacterized protein n=1 Tax=Dreissena polymorpha TaxID=45954 RepID=A0A9D4MM58_DREPO|nr:hypothetical protein DPMN_003644 [Dreissena polymorpha]